MKKNNKRYFLYFITLAFITLAILAGVKFAINEINYQNIKKSLENDDFYNIESQIYEIKEQSEEEASESTDEEVELLQFIPEQPPLLSNQIQEIEELNEKYQSLKLALEKIKNQDKSSQIIIAFIELKDLIESGADYHNQLQKLELLSKSDSSLTDKVRKLRIILKNKPKSNRQIIAEFKALIPKLMSKKSEINGNDNFWSKLKTNMTQFIVIRRVDEKINHPSQNIDFVITRTQKLIYKGNYNQALETLAKLEEDYQTTVIKTIFDLNNAINLREITDEIFSYLKES